MGRCQLDKGWAGYLLARGGQQLVGVAQRDGSLIDGLSFSVTLLMVARALCPTDRSSIQLTTRKLRRQRLFVLVGAAARAEQRVAADTNYFDELACEWSDEDVVLWFVGPEISSRGACVSNKRSDLPTNLSLHFHRGTVQSLFGDEGGLRGVLPCEVDMFIGFNAGFGSFVESKMSNLLLEWLDDLHFLADSCVPVAFTCANDYGDVQGEVAVMSKIVGARFVVAPRENPFAMATTLLGEGVTPEMVEKNGSGWSRGNAFWYAICGVDPQRRCRIERGLASARALAVNRALAAPDIPMERMLADGCTSAGPISSGASDRSNVAANLDHAVTVKATTAVENVQAKSIQLDELD